MKHTTHTLADAITILRREIRKHPLNEAARITDVPRTTIARFRRPTQKVDATTVDAIARGLGFSFFIKPTTAQAKQRKSAA